MDIYKEFKDDLESTFHFIKIFHHVHLVDFMNKNPNNVKVEHIIKDTYNGNHYEVFYKAPKLFETLDYRSNKELDYSIFDEPIIEFKEYELNLDSELFTKNIIIFNNSLMTDVVAVKGFFFNKIFYVFQTITLKEQDEENDK